MEQTNTIKITSELWEALIQTLTTIPWGQAAPLIDALSYAKAVSEEEQKPQVFTGDK